MPVPSQLITDDRDDRREHENDKAHGHADAGQRGGDRDRDHPCCRHQQPHMERIEASNQVVVERIDQSEKDTQPERQR